MIALFLLACVAFAAAANDVAAAERLLERLDLKNYDEFRSEREATSTDSTDSSSDANRIARAVEAALEAAELANRVPVTKPDAEFEKFQLRLSTTNAENRCGFIDCVDVARATATSQIEGATATVETSDGSFTAKFDATGLAEHVNDQFIFTVQYTNGGSGDDTFELTTTANEFGVNVTSISIASQASGDAPSTGIVYFRVAESSDFDDETLLTADETLVATDGESEVGCDVTFDGPNENLVGTSSFTVSVTGERSLIVANETITINAGETNEINIGQTQTFGGNMYVVANQGRVEQIGFTDLPCNSRARVIYDQIAIMTKRRGETANTADTLDHPLLYDSLRTTAAQVGAPSFDSFLFQLRLAAGRTQLRLRDITLDAGVFSDLSHRSKLTPCFRVFPDEDYQVEVYIGMRNAAGQVVRGLLEDANGNNLVDAGAVVFDEQAPPAFDVREVVFGDLVGDQDDTTRPYELLPSDVTIELEPCAETFSYFE